MPGAFDYKQAQSGIKSIQRGTITLNSGGAVSNTATITSVNTSKSELRYLGCSADYEGSSQNARVVLTNATTVTATRVATGSGSGTMVVAWELTEFY